MSASWSDARNLPGIIHKLNDDELGIPPEVIEDWNHRFARKAFDIAEAYVENEIDCVVTLCARGQSFDDCELVFRAVPSVIRDAPVSLGGAFETPPGRAGLGLDSD